MRGFDPGAVVGGLLFLALGVLFLLDALAAIRLGPEIIWPLLLIGAGAGVLAGSLRRDRGEDSAPSGC